MDKNLIPKLHFISANVNFILGTIWLLNYTGVFYTLDFIPRNVYLGLTIASYFCAVLDLIRYMRSGKSDG